MNIKNMLAYLYLDMQVVSSVIIYIDHTFGPVQPSLVMQKIILILVSIIKSKVSTVEVRTI